MNSTEMVARAKVDARAIGKAYKTPSHLIGIHTQEKTIEAQLHLQQMRQAGMIARDTESLYAPMIFGDPPLVSGPDLWEKGRAFANEFDAAPNAVNIHSRRRRQQRPDQQR